MERDGSSRLVAVAVVLAVAALVVSRYGPSWRRSFDPEPRAAYVALLARGATTASDGVHELAAGEPFRLYAVLEAETARGRQIYYTEAPALRLGGRDVPAQQLVRWPAGRVARVRWLTVEGFAPYLQVTGADDLDRFGYVESFHPEWGDDWSVDGVVDPRLVQLEPGSPLRPLPFGSQRWAVRVELYPADEATVPSGRWSSPGADRILTAPGSVLGLVAALPPPLAGLSRAAGLPLVEPGPELAPELAERVAGLTGARLAAVGNQLLAEHLAAAGRSADEVEFRPVVLGPAGPRWGDDVTPGDLLRAGDRVVVLFADAGERGRLDGADLVFDVERGLRIEPVESIFVGDQELVLDLGTLAPAATEAEGR
jgi:hypothetical protein